MKTKIAIRTLTFAALLIALDIIFTRFFRWEIYPYERLSLQFLPHVLAGGMFGPIGAMLTCMAGDLLGMVINSGGLSINPMITGTVMLRGLLYGAFLFRRGKVSFWYMFLAVGVVTVVCDILANSFIMSGFFNIDVQVILVSKLVVRAVATPVYALIAWAVWNRLQRAGQLPKVK